MYIHWVSIRVSIRPEQYGRLYLACHVIDLITFVKTSDKLWFFDKNMLLRAGQPLSNCLRSCGKQILRSAIFNQIVFHFQLKPALSTRNRTESTFSNRSQLKRWDTFNGWSYRFLCEMKPIRHVPFHLRHLFPKIRPILLAKWSSLVKVLLSQRVSVACWKTH